MRPAVSRHEPPASHSSYQAPGATSRRTSRQRVRMVRGEGSVGEVGAVPEGGDDALLDLVPVVRRVVAARIRDPHLVEDLVQETLARMAANRTRLDPEALVPYAIVTARNLIASHVQRTDLERRKAHLVADAVPPPSPEDEALVEERRLVVEEALGRLPQRERELLVAHEVQGTDTATLAAGRELHRGCGSGPAQPEPGEAAGGGPAGPGGPRAADRPVPAGADRAVRRRAAPAARSWTSQGTCWSASSARRSPRHCSTAGPAARTTRCGCRSPGTPTWSPPD